LRAFDAICSTEWDIRPEFLVTMLGIANRENPLDPDIVATLIKPEAISTQDGVPLANADTIEIRDGVAVIPVEGPLMRYASMFSRISGATSYATIARDFGLAIKDPNIKSILLNIDSPGGQVNGVGELASIIHASRGIKPIYAYISNEGASAAYYLASAAEHIIAAPSAIVGSIGTVAAFPNPKADGQTSKTIEIVSSQSPNKRVDITTKEGKSQIQAIVDSLAQVFVDAVALHRNTTVEDVLDNYGQGGVFVGQQALDAGMVDAIGSYESTIAIMSELTKSQNKNIQEVKKEAKSMSFREDLMAFLQGHANDDETPVATNIVPVTPVAANNSTTSIDTNAQEQLRSVQEENRRLRLERYQAEATGFADTLIASNQAFPAEREPIIKLFVQASFDDQTFGASSDTGTSRIEMLKAVMAVRPKHVLTAEQLGPALREFASVNAAPKAVDPNTPLDEDQMAEMLSKTDLGREVLASIKNGSAK
jgi:signal peptide peptidase SppA